MPYTARWYTQLHAGNPGDVTFYLENCRGARSVLELGCGIGRITLPLVSEGMDVTAVDIARDMVQGLKCAAERLRPELLKNLHIVRGDMRTVAFRKRFDRIVIPYNSLLCLLSDDDVVACLASAAAHLSANGLLIFDIYDVPMPAPGEDFQDEIAEEYEHVATIDDGELIAHVYERSIVKPDPRRFDARYQYVVCNDQGETVEVFEYDIEQRCIYRESISHLLEHAGLALVSMTADFNDCPVTDESLQIVVVAKRNCNA